MLKKAVKKLHDDVVVMYFDNKPYEKLVGLMPLELSLLVCKFLERKGCSITSSPNGPRMLEDGLVVPGTNSALSTLRPLLKRLKSEQGKKLPSIKHMKLEIGDN